MPKPVTYRYKWTGEHRVVLTQFQRPTGGTVEVDPGEEFETTEPIDTEEVPFVLSLDTKSDTTKTPPITKTEESGAAETAEA